MKAATRSPKFVSENEVRVTKAFLKNAMVFGTPEYKLWKEIRLDCPNAVMITKDIKRNPNKRTYRNMTYKNMVAYITVHEGANAENVPAEFEIAKASSAIQQSPYRHVLTWFIKRYPNYDEYKDFIGDVEKRATKFRAILKLVLPFPLPKRRHPKTGRRPSHETLLH